MLLMLLLGFVLSPSAAAATPTAFAPPAAGGFTSPSVSEGEREKCLNPTVRQADEQAGNRARRLDELPPGRLEFAVFREMDGCVIPAVVHENIGGNSQPERDERR